MSQPNLDAIRERRHSREFYHSCPGWMAEDVDALLEQVDRLQKDQKGLVGLLRELKAVIVCECNVPRGTDCVHGRVNSVLAYLENTDWGAKP